MYTNKTINLEIHPNSVHTMQYMPVRVRVRVCAVNACILKYSSTVSYLILGNQFLIVFIRTYSLYKFMVYGFINTITNIVRKSH